MLHFSRLQKKPRLLRSLTGVSLPEFTELSLRLEPLWEQEEQERLSHKNRKRRIGAGHPYALPTIQDKLLLLLAYWRHGLTHELLGCLFDLDQSNVTHLLHRLAPLIEPAADSQLKTFLREAARKRKKIGTMEEFLKVVPELQEILGDTTEQVRQRPKGKRQRKKYFSGKKKHYTLKTQIIVTPKGKILHVSKSYPGPTADTIIHEAEKLPSLIPKKTKQYYDRGYQGLNTSHPDHDLRIPYKRLFKGGRGNHAKAPPLTQGQKQANTLRSKRRIPVEHVFSRLKKFRILSVTYRSSEDTYNQTFRGIAALLNFRLTFPVS